MEKKSKKTGKFSIRELRNCILSTYSGEIIEEAKGFKIRCPWHWPDNNPSCMVFYGTGLFYCVVCHGDKPKGKRGVGPYKAFQALGMDEDKARNIFIKGAGSLMSADLEPSHLPDLMAISGTSGTNAIKPLPESKVAAREPWPKWWGFRDVDCLTMQQKWFADRFAPEKVYLKKERLPRLSLSIGGAERFLDTRHLDYLKAEVCLRLSSMVKSKTINSPGLNLDPDKVRPKVAGMFGLVGNRLEEGCRGVLLVEGPYDAIRTLQSIHEIGGGLEVIALLGTPQWDNIRRQIRMHLLSAMTKKGIPLILAFDNDNAGRKLTATAIETLQEDLFPPRLIKRLEYPQHIKDPGDLSSEILLAALSEIESKIQSRKRLVN